MKSLIASLLVTIAMLGQSPAQSSGSLMYDIFNGTTFEEKSLAPDNGKAIGWTGGILSNVSYSPLIGSTSITTLGTITTGTWQATALADTYIASAANWNAKQAALVSGTNLKTVNGTSLLGSGNLAVGNVTDGQTLTTGLTFPFGTFQMINEEDAFKTGLDLSSYGATADRALRIELHGDQSPSINLSGNLTVPSTATISGTNTGDQTTITGNSGTTTAALGLKTATSTVGISTATAPSSGQVLTATSSTAATWQTPAASGVTSVTGTGTVNGLTLSGTVTSTGNLTLGGTLSGVSLTSAVSGTLPVANGGTGATTFTANNVLLGNGTSAVQTVAPGTSGNVLTSNGTTWTSAAPAASGTKTIHQFTPRDNQPPATAFATLDTRNSIAVLDFDTATEEAAIFVGVIPEGATLTSGITVRITWTAATATSGDCRWGAQWMRCNTDIDSDSFDTATEVTTTTNATSGIPNVTSITCTAIDGVTVGDMYRLRIYRDTGDAADTMAGDAELLTVEVRTAN